jgi:hypothetical protein
MLHMPEQQRPTRTLTAAQRDPELRRIVPLGAGMTSLLGSHTFTVQLPLTQAQASGREQVATALSNMAEAGQAFAGRYLLQVRCRTCTTIACCCCVI